MFMYHTYRTCLMHLTSSGIRFPCPVSKQKMAASIVSNASALAGHGQNDVMQACDVSERTGNHVHSTNALIEEEEEEGQAPQVILSAFCQAGKLGLSYYNIESASLHFMKDTVEREDYLLFLRALEQIRPTTVILSSKQDDKLQRTVKLYIQGNGERESQGEEHSLPSNNATLEIIPSSDFGYEACKRRIFALNTLPGMKSTFSEDQRHIFISSLLPLQSVSMVRSLGAMLKYLDKHRVGIELEDTSVRVPIFSVSPLTLDNLVIIDDNSYCALQIFQKESHPSVYKSGKGGKEGLSLFGIANRTKSKLGSQLLRLWFLRPMRDIHTLQERLEAISFLKHPSNEEVVKSLGDCLKNIKHIPSVLVRMDCAQVSMNDWQALYKTAYNAIYIGEVCRTLPQKIMIFKKIAITFTDELQQVAGLINRIVDFDESANQNRFTVKSGVDPELDEKKRTYNGLPDLMTQVAQQELENLSHDIQECNIIYLPQLGYLLAIPQPQEVINNEDFEIEGLDFVFNSNNMVYYKSPRTKEMDTMLGDTQCDILDHETAIMHRLQDVILEHSSVLIKVMEYSAELDCLLSLAILANEHNFVRPELTEDNVIHIKSGRHPLQELCVSSFVPNDTAMNLECGRMKLLTGPNASGKSVYLKQVAIIVFLAHIGCFVPAEEAKIGLMDAIYTRIHSHETVSVPLSTFMLDLNQVSSAARHGTARSLIILDEFGKGTATNDGLSLLTATLRFWLEKGEECPNILVSTHFHSLMHQKLLPTTPLIQYQVMDVVEEEGELVFLYHLKEGQSTHSHACHTAAVAGLPPSIVQRGAEVSNMIRQNLAVSRKDAAKLDNQIKRCEAIVNQFLQLNLESDSIQTFLRDYVIPTSEEIM